MRCYKLTGLFGISHGHAAAILFDSIAKAMGVDTAKAAVKKYDMFLRGLNLKYDFTFGEKYQDVLCHSVNGERLRNNPVSLGDEKKVFIQKNS